MTPDEAKLVSHAVQKTGHDAARQTGGSFVGKAGIALGNGWFRIEDAMGRQHRIWSSMGRLAEGQPVSVIRNADGTRSVIAGGSVDF